MFLWGSYNFKAKQLAEDPNMPVLRYPVYLPPTPAMVASFTTPKTGARLKTESDDADNLLRHIDENRLVVKMIACGQRHIVGLMGLAPRMATGVNAESSTGTDFAVWGMGNNHHGQLGNRVPEYVTTLVRIYVEDLLPPGTSVVSIACGSRHTLIAASNGFVLASGDNTFMQLGTSAQNVGFAHVHGIHNIKRVFAAGNVSFALDRNGQLFSWGEAQHGHLCHGDNGERVDPKTMRNVKTNFEPTLITWFVRHRVIVEDVSVSPTHVVCGSNSGEVYTCGSGTYGKLCTGNIEPRFLPHRVILPERVHPERLSAIAAGADHTLILRESSAVGSVIYHYGRKSNGDSQLVPSILSCPTPLTNVFAGPGTFCAALGVTGHLYVWGYHSNTGVSSGTTAGAVRSEPAIINLLEPFKIRSAAVGGAFIVAVADESHTFTSENKPDRWDIVVAHDDRRRRVGQEESDMTHETGVRLFLSNYLGGDIAAKYITNMPQAAPPTDPDEGMFQRVSMRDIQVGQKVRLWMTDVYALGTVVKIIDKRNTTAHNNNNEDKENKHIQINDDNKPATQYNNGCRVCIHWERDDWHDEEITLYSEDETLHTTNPNRWQPLWFLRDKEDPHKYAKINKNIK
uniref:Uncharacterized protein TCIL3000_11_10830 n=1 Tax=Trypanosoma congolense (strain IL3000) TaxID=1068625 RepID=G0V1T5_TRYCI|nr:unnamed protein product [Trypanosoma congolense IL3000]